VLICELCKREFQDYTSLGSHIGQSHKDIGLKGYYDKFIKTDPEEGICKNPECKKETKFVYLTFGYNRHCSRQCSTKMLRLGKKCSNKRVKQICKFCGKEFKSLVALSSHINHPKSIHKEEVKKLKEEQKKSKKLKCEICGKLYKSFKALGIHIVQFHGKGDHKLKQDYYDKYLKKDPNEGICKTCGKPTEFILLTKGYNTYCNTSCSKLDPEIEQKTKETCLKNHGVTNFAKTEKWLNQMKNGQAYDMISKNTSPSKPQLKLFEIVKELVPSAEIEYWEDRVRRRMDIVIENLQIAIEYDGAYWHQEKHKESDDKRQRELEDLGWKFIRYRGEEGKDTLPSKEQVKNDLEKMLNEITFNLS